MSDGDGVADLHMHTTASDGTCTVAARVSQAGERGLEAIAITDHDTIGEDLSERVERRGDLELITGVEVRGDARGTKVELLGYFVDPTDDRLGATLERVRTFRRERNREMIERLTEVTALDRSYDDLAAEADGLLGRPHMASALHEAGVVDSIREAFASYLAEDGDAYVPMERVPAIEVMTAVQGAGGVVSLAHPGRTRTDDIEGVVEDLVAHGLDAIEVQYPYDEAPQSEDYADVSVEDAAALAEEYDLLRTGGSDCHGPDSGKFRIGEVRITREELDALREMAAERRPL